ncbi:Neuroparsin-A [Caligus rogercresseyi]|uniref:Neuroparsin-A n=1 Tax=Caligus rogercresseyi TaxID=217165 RepID=A0A7T8QX77_CALRO|nr:Neuroparsin-A [Caligus rogercresseyi]
MNALIILTILALSAIPASAYPSYLCRAEAKDVDISTCQYGWVYDLCDVKTCAKGPREHVVEDTIAMVSVEKVSCARTAIDAKAAHCIPTTFGKKEEHPIIQLIID